MPLNHIHPVFFLPLCYVPQHILTTCPLQVKKKLTESDLYGPYAFWYEVMH